MNFRKTNYFLAIFAFVALSFTSCSDDEKVEETSKIDGYGIDFTATLNTYVEDVVLGTYTDMKDNATALDAAVKTYEANPSIGLTNVCSAWRAMRVSWEQSEGFLFGPAALLNLDPSLDSWPLDKSQIDAIISSNLAITSNAIASSNVHGFHAIEYLIFVDGSPRTTALSERELTYLVTATEYLRNDTYTLWANWKGANSISDSNVQTLITAETIEVKYNFASSFKSAGQAGSSFASQSDAIDQVIDGCIDIASEVGSQKIGGPNGSGNVLDVESWYSWNSIEDFSNNILSIRNTYFGGRGKTAATASVNSLSAFVKGKNAALDTEITAAIDKAYKAISVDMIRPFRNNLTGDKVNAAMAACAELETSLTKIKSLRN